jgi:ribosomal protein S18 acetylase RimI-like enzyme
MEDLPLIHELGRQTFYPTYLPFISQEQVDYMFHMMYDLSALEQQVRDKGHVFLLAFSDEGQPLGFVSYQLHYRDLSCKVHKLYVLPLLQAKGTGRALLDSVAEHAGAAGQDSILLNVNRENKAVDFYRHLGFEVALVEDIDIGNGYFMNDYEMKKPLGMQ